jgi:acetyl-CoA C-acetyltransferase
MKLLIHLRFPIPSVSTIVAVFSDGAAAAIVVRADRAKNFRNDPVYIKAIQMAGDSGASLIHNSYDFTHVEPTFRAAALLYQEADVKNPREEIDIMEVHDCFDKRIDYLRRLTDLQTETRVRISKMVLWPRW